MPSSNSFFLVLASAIVLMATPSIVKSFKKPKSDDSELNMDSMDEISSTLNKSTRISNDEVKEKVEIVKEIETSDQGVKEDLQIIQDTAETMKPVEIKSSHVLISSITHPVDSPVPTQTEYSINHQPMDVSEYNKPKININPQAVGSEHPEMPVSHHETPDSTIRSHTPVDISHLVKEISAEQEAITSSEQVVQEPDERRADSDGSEVVESNDTTRVDHASGTSTPKEEVGSPSFNLDAEEFVPTSTELNPTAQTFVPGKSPKRRNRPRHKKSTNPPRKESGTNPSLFDYVEASSKGKVVRSNSETSEKTQQCMFGTRCQRKERGCPYVH